MRRAPDDLALAIDNSLLPLLAESTIRAAVTGPEAELEPGQLDAQIVVTDRGRYAMSKLTALFEEPVPVPVGIHPDRRYRSFRAYRRRRSNCTVCRHRRERHHRRAQRHPFPCVRRPAGNSRPECFDL